MSTKKNPKGAGRKKMPDSEKKVAVRFFFKKKTIENYGGEELFKQTIYAKIPES